MTAQQNVVTGFIKQELFLLYKMTSLIIEPLIYLSNHYSIHSSIHKSIHPMHLSILLIVLSYLGRVWAMGGCFVRGPVADLSLSLSRSLERGTPTSICRSTYKAGDGIHSLSMWEMFQGVWDDSGHLPKSAIFKPMGKSPCFLLKIGRFRTLTNSVEIFSSNPVGSKKSI